jgi:hypothetical protein
MATFRPGVRISQVHGTTTPVDPATGARDATVLAMYHPAAALRTPAIERESYDDIGGAPRALLDARARRAAATTGVDPLPDEPAAIAPVADDETAFVAAGVIADPAAELTIF